jgi:hypothetical protein
VLNEGYEGKVYLIERDERVFEWLKGAVFDAAKRALKRVRQRRGQVEDDDEWLKREANELLRYIELVHGDYCSEEVARKIGKPSDAVVFINIDPNSVNSVELSSWLRANLKGALVNWMISMGCNAGGVKMLKEGERAKWRERLIYLLGTLELSQDVCLVSLQGDVAQWAYLLCVPSQWHERIEKLRKGLSEHWPRGVDIHWHSDGGLLNVADEFFLTKAEHLEKYGDGQMSLF